MDVKLKEYYRWYEQTYARIINLDKLRKSADKDQNKWLRNLVDNFKFQYSSIWRHEVLSNMRYYLFPKKTEYICSSFKLIREGSSSILKSNNIQFNTIYCILYTYCTYDKKNGYDLKFEFTSSCPTFKSADGEYRHRFITLEQILRTRENNLEKFEEIEENFLKQIHKKEVLIEVNHIIPEMLYDDEPNKKKEILKTLHKALDKLRLPVIFYVSSWIIDFYRFVSGRIENHISDGYKEAMFHHEDPEFYVKWRKDLKPEVYNSISSDLTRIKKDPKQRITVLEIGQKFIPLTVYEVEEINNIKLSPWREIYINNLVGDLVINGISPSFPIFDDWFLIQGNSADFWDNRVSHIKIDHSEITKEIVKKLEDARKGTYIIDPIKKKEIYLSFNMEGLSEAVEIPMNYAEQELILADTILCSLNEHVGRTLADIPRLLVDKDFSMQMGPLFQDAKVFAKYVFEFIYGLYCLNTKLGVIHGDLHLNNVTFFVKRLFYNIETGEYYVKNPHIIYNILEEYYIYKHHSSTSCIIDNSRAFTDRENLAKSFGEEEVDEIMQHQKNRMLRIFEREIPDFYNDHKDQFHFASFEHFDLLYKIFMAIDSYKLTRGLINLTITGVLENKDHLKSYGDVKVIKSEILPLLNKINSISYNYITTNLGHLFNRKLDLLNLENINLLIIQECFKDFNLKDFKSTEEITLVDFFSSENEMVCDTKTYEKFPETIKFEYIIKNKIPTEEIGLKNYEEYQKYLKEESIDEKLKHIKEELIEEKQVRRGSPEPPSEQELKKDTETYYYDT